MNFSTLFQVRGIISKYIKRYELYIKVFLKFAAYLVLFRTMSDNAAFAGEGVFNSFMVQMVLALVSTLLPSRCGVLIALAICVYNIFQASLIGSVIMGAMMLVLYISMARMFPDQVYFLVLIPLCIDWNLHLLVPLFAGLYVGVVAVVPVVAGVLMWGLQQIIPAFMTLEMGESLDALPKMISDASTYGIDQITKNEQMVFLLIIFSGIILVVSLLRKLRLDYVRYIALGAGGILGLVCLIMGKAVGSLSGNMLIMILVSILTVAVLAVMEFLNLSLHYKSAQDLEFEDEDYFYQVRAIPKINPVSKPKKKITKIHEPLVKETKPKAEKNTGVKPLRKEYSKEKAMSELFDK